MACLYASDAEPPDAAFAASNAADAITFAMFALSKALDAITFAIFALSKAGPISPPPPPDDAMVTFILSPHYHLL